MGWTVKTLKQHYDALLKERNRKVNQRFDAIKQAIKKSDAYAKYRDKKQNEFRKALDDQNNNFARKKDVKYLTKCLDEIKEEMNRVRDVKQGGSQIWPYIFSIISLIGTVVMIIIYISK